MQHVCPGGFGPQAHGCGCAVSVRNKALPERTFLAMSPSWTGSIAKNLPSNYL